MWNFRVGLPYNTLFINHLNFNGLKAAFWCRLLILTVCFEIVTGCSYKNKNILFKYPQYRARFKAEARKGVPVIKLKPDSSIVPYQFKLRVDDAVSLSFINFPEDLMRVMVAASSSGGVQSQGGSGGQTGQSAQGGGAFQYTIDLNGDITLPLIGRMPAVGKTLLQLRQELEKNYSRYCKEPLVEVRATTMRISIYGEVQKPGVVHLPQERTHITEVIALAGGVQTGGKARSVQIVRGDLKDPQIILADLQTIDALKSEDLIVHAGDVIYVEPRNVQQVSREIQQFQGILGLVSLFLSLTTLIVILTVRR